MPPNEEEVRRIINAAEDADAFPHGDAYEGDLGDAPQRGNGADGHAPGDVDEAGVWDAGEDTAPIPPRGWLLGNTFCRRFVSALVGPGASGKSSVRIAQCLALATGRPLTGEHVFRRCRVLLVSLEDDRDELRRRVRTAMRHHGIKPDDVRGWFYLATPRGLRLASVKDGAFAVGQLPDLLRQAVTRWKLDLVALDPLVKAHALDENSNQQMDSLAAILTDLAAELDIAIDVTHHVRKGPAVAGDADAGRGASAFRDAARLVHSLTPMTEEEAKALGLVDLERRSLVRLDPAKVNIAPPAARATWFRLVGVPLKNGTEDYPAGDSVQSAEQWRPPDLFAKIGTTRANEILDRIERGLEDGQRYSPAPQAKHRAVWPVVQEAMPELTDAQCRTVISGWLKTGVLEARDYESPLTRKEEQGLWVNVAKRPGTRHG
jgi:hypothetical protein